MKRPTGIIVCLIVVGCTSIRTSRNRFLETHHAAWTVWIEERVDVSATDVPLMHLGQRVPAFDSGNFSVDGAAAQIRISVDGRQASRRDILRGIAESHGLRMDFWPSSADPTAIQITKR